MPRRPSGRIQVPTILEPIPANRFYARVKKRPGPKGKGLSEALRAPPKPVENPYRSYTIRYKLRILSYWQIPSIPTGPTQLRKPSRIGVAEWFKIPPRNISRWRKEEAEGKYKELSKQQCRQPWGGRKRKWELLERNLYDRFHMHRAKGRNIRRGWFREVSKELYKEHYPVESPTTLFCFSNGWLRGFLRWHRISLRFVTNKSSQLPSDFGEVILSWMRFNRRNSQLHLDEGRGVGDIPRVVGRYQLSNISNIDQIPLPYKYLEGRTYNRIGDRTIWVQSSHSGWDKRQVTIQLTVFADAVPRVKPLVLFR